MGIRYLNKHLRQNCPQSIRSVNMSDLSGKIIVVDTSIYLYRYETEDNLLENIYLMLAIFKEYKITPIFIFDGKPPPEKKALLIKRKQEKEQSQEEFNILKNHLNTEICHDERQETIAAMEQLKKQIVVINKVKIEKIKSLIRAFGATYYDAHGEADELCAALVLKKKAWACLSEDMDLFVYGCTRVLRYFSLVQHTAILYYTKGILEELDMSQNEFKDICILSGTDYNINKNGITTNLQLSLKYFKQFKNSNNYKENEFYIWLLQNTKYIYDIELLKRVNKMFDLDVYKDNIDLFKSIKIMNGPIIQKQIEDIMKEENFIFCN